jgi:hypothetical protein
MRWAVDRGRTRPSRLATSGGPTCSPILARADENRVPPIYPVRRAFHTLADEPRETILVVCSKCAWRAAFSRAELIASHGADHPMPNLLDHLAAPGCSRRDFMWDRCGVHYAEAIGA